MLPIRIKTLENNSRFKEIDVKASPPALVNFQFEGILNIDKTVQKHIVKQTQGNASKCIQTQVNAIKYKQIQVNTNKYK